MDLAATLKALAAAGSAQNRKVQERHGVRGPAFGVSYADLRKLAKTLGRDHALSLGLWASGNHDARVLATLVADPARMTAKTLEAWGKDLDNYVLADALSAVAAASPAARACADRWTSSRNEWIATAGWNIVARLAGEPSVYGEDELRARLGVVEATLHDSPNRVRYAMNGAVIAIGLRSPALQRAAVAAARRIGAVEVDHGETGCKTPEAEAYILKAAAYRAARGRKAGGAQAKGGAAGAKAGAATSGRAKESRSKGGRAKASGARPAGAARSRGR